MLVLSSTGDYLVFFAIVIGGGAFGGVIYELLLQRGRDTGALAIPRRHAAYLDLGWVASVLVGIAAAVVVLYLLAPIIERADAQGVATRTYDVVKLIALSVVVGSAGPSVLSAMQARVIAALEAQRADDTADVATAQLDTIQTSLEEAQGAGTLTESTRSSLGGVERQVAAAKQAVAALRRE